jgi:hypothetical protein
MLENAGMARETVINSPTHSARRQSVAFSLSGGSFHCILHDDLKFHLQTIQTVQQLQSR